MATLFDGFDSVRAITIWQPWASLIVAGVKRVENRSWSTPYRGPLLIHAAARPVDKAALARLAELGISVPAEMPRGVILGVVDLVDVVRHGEATLFGDLRDDPLATGPECWRLENPRALPAPVARSGQQGMWSVPVDVARSWFAGASSNE